MPKLYKILAIYRPDVSSDYTRTVTTFLEEGTDFWQAANEAESIAKGNGQPYSRHYHVQTVHLLEISEDDEELFIFK